MNASVLKELQNKNPLRVQINHTFEHIARRTGEIENLGVKGEVERKRPRGRPLMRLVDRLKEITGHSVHDTSGTK